MKLGAAPKPFLPFFACLTAVITAPGVMLAADGDTALGDVAKRSKASPASQTRVVRVGGKVPLAFEPNQGQTDKRVEFLSRGPGYTLYLTGDEAVLSLKGQKSGARSQSRNSKGEIAKAKLEASESAAHSVLHMKLAGANATAKAVGTNPLPSKSNYLIGNDPKKWRRNVPNFARVKYAGVYPGIDLVYYGNQRQLEYDFIVAPGADLDVIRFSLTPNPSPTWTGRLEGQGEGTGVRLDASGDLVIPTDSGEMRFHKPVVYQDEGGKRWGIEGSYVLLAGNRVGFEVGSYDESLPLIIDPVLSYSTYLGGSGTDQGFGFDADAAGNAYVVGFTDSANFPPVAPIQGTYGGGIADCFITKINAAGTAFDFSTYLGGSDRDFCRAISVDSTGNMYLKGETRSSNFPVVNAFQTTLKGIEDSFVTKLSPDGSTILYSTYLGSTAAEDGVSIVADDSGRAYTTGATQLFNFPVTAGAFQSTFGGGSTDLYFSVLDTNLSGTPSLIYSTFLGAGGVEFPLGIAIDSGGKAYIVGDTRSATGFPVTAGAFQSVFAGGTSDAFVVKFDPTQSGSASLIYSTLLGGSGTEAQSEIPRSIAVDASGQAYVASDTTSTNFPVTVGAFQATNAGGSSDAFFTVLNSTGTALVYSTYLGGTGQDIASGVNVDSGGNAYVVGIAGTADFPIKNAFDQTFSNGKAFVAQFNPFQSGAASLNFSSFLGGTGGDQAYNVDFDSVGNVYVSGITNSSNFPTVNPIQASSGGGQDSFVAKLTPTLFGATPYLSQADSPFFADIQAGNMYLETFEDVLLNTPGVTASAGQPNGPGGLTDSVDSDDGVIDGSGTNGISFFSGDGPGGITFTFNATALGGFPTKAGIAWTDSGAGATVTFEAFDNVGASLGVVGPLPIADGSNVGTTAEDRFFGAVNPAGISAIHISNSSGGIEVDHLQYGLFAVSSTLTFAPGRLTFADQNVGTTSGSQNVVVTNMDVNPVTINSITVAGNFALAGSTDCPSSGVLGGNASCNLDLTFTPTSSGMLSGQVFISSTDGGRPHVIPLVGAGVGASVDPVAFINQPLVPTSVAPGAGPFTLTVNGTGFVSGATVNWTVTGIVTHLTPDSITPTQLTVTVPASLIATANTASVTVVNPNPGDRPSNIVFFHVTNSTASVLFSNAPGSPIATGTAPRTVTVGDFNGDGKMDLAIANYLGNNLTILLGNGDGTYVPTAQSPATGTNPHSVAVGDFNGDGKLDLTVANETNNNLTILLGNGDGTFAASPQSPTTGSGPLSVAVGDINADGKLDLAVANSGGNTVTILLGNGDGTFTAAAQSPNTDTNPVSVAAGDFNGDGSLDLAVANFVSETVTILLGNGDGTFTPTASSPGTGTQPRWVAAADVNSDGILDLAVANIGSNNLTILLGDGAGNFTPTAQSPPTGTNPHSVAAGDFNGDGKLDLAAANDQSNDVTILLGNGDGTFTPTAQSPTTGLQPRSVAVGDFNGDGRLDLADANFGGNTVSVLLQTAAPAPAVQLSTNNLNFGEQLVDITSPVMQVTLTNSGNATLNFTSFNVQLSTSDTTASPHFSSNNNCGTTLGIGLPCTINVFFTPLVTGPFSAVIKIVSDAPGSPHFITLTGTGTANPAITLGPAVNFTGNPLNITCPTKDVTLTNSGDVPLDITSIVATAPFSVASHTCPATLAVDTSCIIKVKFSPAVVGPAAGTLTVTTNPATTGNVVNLSGNGTPACSLRARLRSVTVLRGSADAQDFAIEDAKPSCSPVELNLTCSVDNPAACLLNPAVIAPSGASTLQVRNLKRVGADSLQVTVTSTSEFRTATEVVSVRFADFAITQSPDAATVRAGEAASYALAVRPVNGLAGNVTFTCSGAPRGATCAVEPSSITLDGASLAQVNVNVTTSSRAGAAPIGGIDFGDGSRRLVPLLIALLALLAVAASRRRALVGTPALQRALLAAMMLAMLAWASCGGGGGSMNFGSGGTPAGNFTLTVTGTYSSSTGATPGTLSNSTTVALKVN